MNRRRLLWLGIPLIALGGIVAAWFWISQRDADFVVIGPKTKGVRDNFALLDTTIDPADYRDCKTVQDAVAQLNRKLRPKEPIEDGFGWMIWPNLIHADDQAIAKAMIDTNASLFEPPAAKEPMTVKQFLRFTYARRELPEVAFIVRGHYIEVTTAKHAQEEKTRYLDSVSVYDRVHGFWKEITGTVEPDVPVVWVVD